MFVTTRKHVMREARIKVFRTAYVPFAIAIVDCMREGLPRGQIGAFAGSNRALLLATYILALRGESARYSARSQAADRTRLKSELELQVRNARLFALGPQRASCHPSTAPVTYLPLVQALHVRS
jgi:hypothetical protein